MDESAEITWQVSPLHQDDLPRTLDVAAEGMTLGRAADNTVELDGMAYPEVSAHHARLVIREGQLVLEDLGSTHGVLLEGEPIKRAVVHNGQIFMLGPGGPRFVVHVKHDLTATSTVPAAVVPRRRASREIGDETVEIVAEKLGIKTEGGVEAMIEKRTRHLGALGVVIVVMFGIGIFILFRAIRSTGERTAALATSLEEQVEQNAAATEEEIQVLRTEQLEVERASEQWARQRAELVEERESLEQAIHRLEAGEKSAAGDLAALQERLESTTSSLALYNPVTLEQHRVEVVERIEDSVVMIEASQYLIDKDTGKELHFELDEEDSVVFNFDDRGERFSQEVTGSGFCVSPEGYIITNAHVVLKGTDSDGESELGPPEFFETRTVLNAVFSGTRERHPVELITWVRGEREDLALVRIEPFDAMPFLPELDLEVPAPPRGTEVFVLGFPLGKQVLHEGDLVIASTFRGIVSRRVEYYLQIDAAIHPGASGGPVIDGEGRIIGIVTGVQALDLGTQSSAIGYIIPIAEAHTIWPPPPAVEAPDPPEEEEEE